MKSVYAYLALVSSTIYATKKIEPIAPPTLTFPLHFAVTRSCRLPIRGTTEPNFYICFYIDDVLVGETKSNYDGSFSYRLIGEHTLKRGIYTLTVVATDPNNVTRTSETTITFAVSDCGYYDSLYAQQFIIKIIANSWREKK